MTKNDRDEEIAHLRRLQAIHRQNLAHYQQQAKAYGGLDFAPPITRYGMEYVLADLLSDGLLMDTDNGERCDAAALAALDDLIAASQPPLRPAIVRLILVLLLFPALAVGAAVALRDDAPWLVGVTLLIVALLGWRWEEVQP